MRTKLSRHHPELALQRKACLAAVNDCQSGVQAVSRVGDLCRLAQPLTQPGRLTIMNHRCQARRCHSYSRRIIFNPSIDLHRHCKQRMLCYGILLERIIPFYSMTSIGGSFELICVSGRLKSGALGLRPKEGLRLKRLSHSVSALSGGLSQN